MIKKCIQCEQPQWIRIGIQQTPLNTIKLCHCMTQVTILNHLFNVKTTCVHVHILETSPVFNSFTAQ